jgi:hypothetical protein
VSALHDAASAVAPAPHHHGGAFVGPWMAPTALIVHTLGYLLVTALIAVVVYEKVGLEVLRKAWVNLDLIWAVVLIATAGFTLLVPT